MRIDKHESPDGHVSYVVQLSPQNMRDLTADGENPMAIRRAMSTELRGDHPSVDGATLVVWSFMEGV